MKEKIIIAAILIVITLVIVGVLYAVTATEQYEEPAPGLGIWGTDITINYADGTSKPYKIMQDNLWLPSSPLYITDEGGTITSFDYTLSVKATGEGYTTAELDFSGPLYLVAIEDISIYFSEALGTSFSLSVDSQFHELFSVNIPASAFDGMPVGTHNVRFQIQESTLVDPWYSPPSVQYRGIESGGTAGEWGPITLPGDKHVTFEVHSDLSLSLVWDVDVD